MERRSEAEVCTNEVRKMRVPLARARDGVPQESLVTESARDAQICFLPYLPWGWEFTRLRSYSSALVN